MPASNSTVMARRSYTGLLVWKDDIMVGLLVLRDQHLVFVNFSYDILRRDFHETKRNFFSFLNRSRTKISTFLLKI